MNNTKVVRRRHPRAHFPLPAFVVLDDGRSLGPFVIENLSAGGALLTGTVALVGGTTGVVKLRLPDADQWMHIPATVVWSAEGITLSAHGFSFAVEFREVSAENEDLIQSAVLQAIEASRVHFAPAVLVLDESREDRQALGQILVGLGQRAFPAETFLDALRLLQDQELRVEVALVDLLVRQVSGLDVLAFLAEDFPGVRRVLMSRDADAPALHLARSSGSAHAMLIKPSAPMALAAAIGLEERAGW